MKESQQTKKTKIKKIILGLIHFLLVFGPLLFFFPYAFIIGETVTKVTMSLSIVISIVLGAISALIDVTKRGGFHKSIMWILIIAVLTALTEVKAFIYIMAGTSILDELIICPLHERSRNQLITNRELDKRL
jgi:hypothetical protein